MFYYCDHSISGIVWLLAGDALWLGRWPQVWSEVIAAYHRVHDYVTCAGWLTRDRDQLRTPTLVNSSMGLPLPLLSLCTSWIGPCLFVNNGTRALGALIPRRATPFGFCWRFSAHSSGLCDIAFILGPFRIFRRIVSDSSCRRRLRRNSSRGQWTAVRRILSSGRRTTSTDRITRA